MELVDVALGGFALVVLDDRCDGDGESAAGVQEIQLEIPQGQGFSLLGPSGCGKTSTAEGTLKSFDEKTKELTIAPKEGKATKVTLTPETKGADGVKDLVGKAVTVEVSVHAKSKALSVAATK